MLPDGYYAVRSGQSDMRLLWLKTLKGDQERKSATLFGKRVLFYRKANGWQAFAFVGDDENLHIHKKFLFSWKPEQLQAVREAFLALKQDPRSAMALYKQIQKK